MKLSPDAESVIANAADDLQTMGAIMIAMGHPSTNIEFHGGWFVWFGRQIDILGEQMERAMKEAP